MKKSALLSLAGELVEQEFDFRSWHLADITTAIVDVRFGV